MTETTLTGFGMAGDLDLSADGEGVFGESGFFPGGINYGKVNFGSGGFGKWEAKKATKINKDKMSPLIISSQLRKSVSSKVEEN